jgi:hypothetical protein
MRKLGVSLLALGAAVVANTAEAKVTKIVIDTREPALGGKTFGAVGAYEVIRGRAFGEVDPADRRNAIIQDIALAPKNARGNVEYISTFTMLKPIDAAKGNGVLYYQISNRGGNILTANSGTDADNNSYLYERGYTILGSGWQADLLPGPTATQSVAGSKVETVTVPRAKNADGSPITGPFMIRIPLYGPGGASGTTAKVGLERAGTLAYSPVSLDTTKSTLSVSKAENIRGEQVGPRTQIGSTEWMWTSCKTNAAADAATPSSDLCIKLNKGEFDPNLVYTLVFPAKDPLVLGLGLAAMRDVAAFFRYAKADEAGTANPVAGAVPHAVAQGISQSGNTAKLFIHLGFNEDEQGRLVWDAVQSHIASRFTPVNFRFAIPGGSPTMFAPGNEGALWWSPTEDTVRGRKTASLLDRCTASKTCPKVFETFGGAEMWNQRMSLGMVGSDAKRDVPLPANVRRYYFPGTTHGGGSGGFNTTTKPHELCVMPANPNSQREQVRAVVVAMTDWVAKGTEPPPSKSPTIQAGLLTDGKKGGPLKWPAIPGVPEPYGLTNPVLDYDFGPTLNGNDLSGYISEQPPKVKQALPSLVPIVDVDGNDLGGQPSVLHSAPLGTYMGWNVTRIGAYAGQICSLNGSFVPFAKTKAEREKAEDPRPSIEERYGDRQGYVCAVRTATKQQIKERFLLEQDAKRLIDQATKSTETGDLAFLPASSTARGQALCSAANATD